MLNFVFLFLILSSPQVTAGNLLVEFSMPSQLIPVTIQIEFGPAGKGLSRREIFIPNRSTPKQALSKIFPIEEGAICCNPGEVKGIDGVRVDPLKNRWWKSKINGSEKKPSPQRSHLKAHDLVEWIYFEDIQ